MAEITYIDICFNNINFRQLAVITSLMNCRHYWSNLLTTSQTFMFRMSWKSGSLKLLEFSGPHWACYGTALRLLV